MLRICADESGIDPSNNYCVVAGYLGFPETWVSVEKQWKTILDSPDYQVPCFHARKVFAEGEGGVPLKEPYKSWGREKTDQFLGELVQVIHTHDLCLVGCAIVKSDFFSFTVKERRLLTGALYNYPRKRLLSSGKPSEPYFCGFTFLVQNQAGIDPIGPPIEFMFDRQEKFSGWATEFFQQSQLEENYSLACRLGSLSFRDKSELIGVQSADLVAYLWNRYLNHQLSGTRLQAMDSLASKPHNRGVVAINADVMNELISQFPQEVVDALPEDTM